MIKIMFVCHGNICRSPMAEFIFKNMVKQKGMSDNFYIASCATSTEEIGNSVYPPAKRKLMEHNISCEGKRSVQLRKEDYNKFDYLVAMDQKNMGNIFKIIKEDPENKVYKLLNFTTTPKDIADPWYSGDFDTTYNEIYEGCRGLLDFINNRNFALVP
ncbi:low molecular weight phosphotyrosine protein phosphatase [Clostridium chromiireducens]|uniref:protein-tyrosine-phosphatase n=1 Tax=Clostridium chromiireducens TaxID=225345 RepID=A0A964RSH1_9CLOT|nr:low molecular weight protein-tyrosine-phosphatase [Clostridium chromiireducens]MVX67016.1 low molecular weight phosphotyrosine protein phosphatase [Clostridium chromiireducens]